MTLKVRVLGDCLGLSGNHEPPSKRQPGRCQGHRSPELMEEAARATATLLMPPAPPDTRQPPSVAGVSHTPGFGWALTPSPGCGGARNPKPWLG